MDDMLRVLSPDTLCSMSSTATDDPALVIFQRSVRRLGQLGRAAPDNQSIHYYWGPLFPLPDTEAPNLPNCLPRPDLGLAAGGVGTGLSFTGTGGPAPARPTTALGGAISAASRMRRSPTPKVGWSSRSPPSLCARLARSCTLRNFSSSSAQRMMPSSRPLSRFGLSNDAELGVAALLRGAA